MLKVPAFTTESTLARCYTDVKLRTDEPNFCTYSTMLSIPLLLNIFLHFDGHIAIQGRPYRR